MTIKERFLKYVAIDTQSSPDSNTCPSTSKQLDFAEILVKELNDIGMDSVELDDNGYIYAKLNSTLDKTTKKIGFIAHMDTAPSFDGSGVKPKIIEKYDGGDIVLNKSKEIILSPKDFPELKQYKGQELITTDGTTLLGADDKAGIAEIMAAMDYIVSNDISHGDIRVGFTPDEEIGRGADKFDVEKFDADYAYTIDGGEIGELEYENFNAASAKITINGVNVHPGSAKNKMKNAIRMGMALDAMLPEFDRPEYTENYEGFFHLLSMKGDVEKTSMHYIIRDHDQTLFEQKKAMVKEAIAYLNKKYGEKSFELSLEDSYYNMREKIVDVYEIVEAAEQAMKQLDIEPHIVPIRGGTDGARLSYMGLPTPNIFTGGHNYHGKFEFIPTQSMEKATELIIKLASQ